MALPPFDLLGTVVATLFSAHARGLDRLGIHDGRAGLRVPLEAYPRALAQGRVHPLPRPVQTPEPKVVVDGFPRREVVRLESPGAAALYDVEDGVEDLAQGIDARTPVGFRSGKVGF